MHSCHTTCTSNQINEVVSVQWRCVTTHRNSLRFARFENWRLQLVWKSSRPICSILAAAVHRSPVGCIQSYASISHSEHRPTGIALMPYIVIYTVYATSAAAAPSKCRIALHAWWNLSISRPVYGDSQKPHIGKGRNILCPSAIRVWEASGAPLRWQIQRDPGIYALWHIENLWRLPRRMHRRSLFFSAALSFLFFRTLAVLDHRMELNHTLSHGLKLAKFEKDIQNLGFLLSETSGHKNATSRWF